MKKLSYKALLIACAAVFGATALSKAARPLRLDSPDKRISVTVDLKDKIYYTVTSDGQTLMRDNALTLDLGTRTLGRDPKIRNAGTRSVNESLTPVVAFKFSEIPNRYNELRLNFRDGYSIEFRAYDDGVAYRWITSLKGDIEVMHEEVSLGLPQGATAIVQQSGGFKTAYEEPYSKVTLGDWKPEDKMSNLPLLIDTRTGHKILVSESDLRDYPCLFLKGTGTGGITSTFPKQPLEFGPDGDRSLRILREADYIARTDGSRSFPWRYFVIAREDGQLIENTMTARLAASCEIADPSWIRPGQVSWEWWNGATPYGPDVNFVSGFNLDTYKYFIDFASKYGIPYIIMDEGWAMSTLDPYTPNPAVDVHELIRYGREKNVGIVLWLTWLVVENHMELFETFREWGVSGLKIDFMDRSDQWMVNYYERVAKAAADNGLFVAFHGSFKPAGLEYRYPNVLAYEGVRGMEQMGGCTPDNSIWFPFMRNAVGPMDYTPGAMLSMQPEVYQSERPNSASIGTRAYQMALFVIFETGLQMLADNPTLYYRNAECTDFISQVPVTWDETRALAAEAGEYAVVAKRKGDQWFIGGMTNGAERVREIEIALDFLPQGETLQMTSFEDGINAGRQAMDYRKKESTVRSGDKLTLRMVRNGGWAAVIR